MILVLGDDNAGQKLMAIGQFIIITTTVQESLARENNQRRDSFKYSTQGPGPLLKLRPLDLLILLILLILTQMFLISLERCFLKRFIVLSIYHP